MASRLLFAGRTLGRSVLVVPRARVNPSAVRFFSATDDLVSLLAREHAEEQANETTMVPPELSDLKSQLQQEWKIVDDSAMTRMYKSVGSTKIQLSFHCQDSVENVYDDEEEEGIGGDEASAPIKFTVTASKAGKTLVLTCLSEDATVRVQSVAMSNRDIEALQADGLSEDDYQGPEFEELADDLQDAFHAYLEDDLGIAEDVASFVAMYADYKEQKEYVDFLEGAKSLLS